MHSSSGHEGGGGGHVCNKCGWPFPNPHPSARHRRSHRKVCGTLEGYKLLASHDQSASLSDEDHLSDDDHKTPSPSPKPAEKIGVEEHGGRGGNGERSNRSEDEVFTDAVTEFNETGLGIGNEEHSEDARLVESNVEKIPSRNLTMFYSFKDSAVADTVEPPSNSSDSGVMPIPKVRENATNSPESNLEFQVPASSSTEESATTFSDDRNKLACALGPIKPETSCSELQENKMINASADVAEGLMAYSGQETAAKGDGKIAADRVTDTSIPKEYADQPSETQSKSQEAREMTSHLLSTGGVVLSKESQSDATAAKMSSGDLIPGLDSVEHVNIIDTVPMNANANAKQDLGFDSSVNLIEGYSGKGEANDNVHELSVPANIPVVDHAEIKLEGFKDLKEVKSNNSVHTESLEIIEDKKDDAEYPVSVENFASFQSMQFSEVPRESASNLHVSEDNLVHEYSKPMVEEQSTDGKSDVSQIKLSCNEKSDELGTPVASVSIEKESFPVGSLGKQPSSFVCDDSLHKASPETALNDVCPMASPEDANAIGLNNAGNYKNAINETNDVIGNDENRSAEEVNNAKDRITFSESPTYCPEVPVSQTTKVHESDDTDDHEKGKIKKSGSESDDTDDHEKGKIKKSALMGVGTEKEPVQEKLPGSEYATSLHKIEVGDDVMDMTIMDMTAMKLPETKFGNLDAVSYTQDGPEQLEISANDKAQEKQVAEHVRGVELLERTSEEYATKVPPVSTFGTESSIQSSVIDDNHTGEFHRGDSVTNLSVQGESTGNQHQLGASLVDASVDTLSQTDSLEANWGSISVLSTQSDTVVVDAETLPSTDCLASAETEKPNMKAKGAADRQHSSKSDIFEAPSFMTLVEPGGGANHRAAAAPQTQTSQNLQQHNAASSQAGWFPSLTHVVNESEGRKKNEEIIAKVTNWSTGKPHTPLKNLLGEAKHEMRPKSPNPKENQSYATRKDEAESKDNGAAVTTVSSIMGPEDTKREMGKEGNSPARYPADIKREKRKVKGRPYWAQFMCCSSVN